MFRSHTNKVTLTMAIILIVSLVSSAKGENALSGSDLLVAVRKSQGVHKQPAYSEVPEETPPTVKSGKVANQDAAEARIAAIEDVNSTPGPGSSRIYDASDVVNTKKPLPSATKTEVLSPPSIDVPADSPICVKISSMDYFLAAADEFLSAALPMPAAISTTVRTNLAAMLGSANLTGLDTTAGATIFAIQKQNSQQQLIWAAILPITDLNQFLGSSANLGPPDNNGISALKKELPSSILVSEVPQGIFAAAECQYQQFHQITDALNNSPDTYFSKISDRPAALARNEIFWAHIDVQKLAEQYPTAIMLVLQKAYASELFNGKQSYESTDAVMPGPNAIMSDLKSVTITLKPSAQNLVIRCHIAYAKDGALSSTINPEKLRAILAANNPKKDTAENMGSKAMDFIPDADTADVAGVYNIVRAQVAALRMAGIPVPEMQAELSDGMAYTINITQGSLDATVILPSSHLLDILRAQQLIKEQVVQMPQDIKKQSPEITDQALAVP